MNKRAEIVQANAQLTESIISYAKEHTVMAGLVYREGVKYGYEQAEKDTIERVAKWLIEHINIDYDVQQSDDGQPLASDYIKYAKKRFEVANQIANEFRKAMEEE